MYTNTEYFGPRSCGVTSFADGVVSRGVADRDFMPQDQSGV